jgi:hypothetical protein
VHLEMQEWLKQTSKQAFEDYLSLFLIAGTQWLACCCQTSIQCIAIALCFQVLGNQKKADQQVTGFCSKMCRALIQWLG